MKVYHSDVIIIGSGIAGLMAAELLSLYKNVIVITKSNIDHSNSMLAQGGIAAVTDSNDDWRDHFFDTLRAGCYYNNESTTELLVKRGSEMIEKLEKLGVQFDKEKDGSYVLAQEGAHSKRRILHAGGDATGKELTLRLIDRVKKHVTIHEHTEAVDLIVKNGQCHGVLCLDDQLKFVQYYAPHVILATGGAGQLYSITSNHPNITGDGLALAYRAGARLVDMEFVQFHPTMLIKDGKGAGLVSEAVRGEGARLVTEDGKYLMDDKHTLGDLAPRDVVAREIFQKTSQNDPVFLDIRSIKNFHIKFPSVSALCLQAGIQMEDGLIPVTPGAHFLMGGIETNARGETSIEGLYAIGEVAHTGVHGANRLASNSLLEGLVFANELARTILHSDLSILKKVASPFSWKLPKYNYSLPTVSEIQTIMSKYVGIVRTKEQLVKALNWFLTYKSLMETKKYEFTPAQQNIRNMLTVGFLITASALSRTESRGSHYRTDFPLSRDHWMEQTVFCSIHQDLPYVLDKKSVVNDFVI